MTEDTDKRIVEAIQKSQTDAETQTLRTLARNIRDLVDGLSAQFNYTTLEDVYIAARTFNYQYEKTRDAKETD